MSANAEFRNRLIALLYDAGDMPAGKAARLADAVIAELFSVEHGQPSNPDGPLWGLNNRHTVTRYVTAWRRDDDATEAAAL